jgi:hypothetical protein
MCEVVERIELAQDGVRWWAIVNALNVLRVSQSREFLNQLSNCQLSYTVELISSFNWLENLKERDHVGELGVNERKMLKWVLEKYEEPR